MPASVEAKVLDGVAADLRKLRENLRRVVQGKDAAVTLLTTAFVAEGHVLIEDLPGLGKTALARAFARSVDCPFHRIQFTPDLVPSDILGASIYDPSNQTFRFQKGPIFAGVVLADEINRATPRTQSALLEAMSERQVTVEGQTHPLARPFMVVATQNPQETAGTFPLPDSQLDRFLLSFSMGYPDADAERDMLERRVERDPLDSLTPVVSPPAVQRLFELRNRIRVDAAVQEYLLRIVRATREDERVRVGASPRATLGLFHAARAEALVAGRDYVVPDDVRRMAGPVLAHRLALGSGFGAGGDRKRALEVVAEILDKLDVPL